MNSKMLSKYINLHTHRPTGRSNQLELVNVELSDESFNRLPACCSVGIHPWHSTEINNTSKLSKVAQKKEVIAIGESGLDKLRGGSHEEQVALFQQHIEISEKLHKPLIIHCVRYFNEIITLRKEIKAKQAWIFHGFNGSKQLIEQAVNNGFYLSFGASLLHSPSKAAQNLKYVPLDRLFFETDNTDENIETIYKKASTLLNIDVSNLMKFTNSNFHRIFK